ncbi:MAG: hypothetical protein QM778_33230 [Myxococcales bacterium]
MTSTEFIELCKSLREMGATSVTIEGEKLAATFAPVSAPRAAQPPTEERRDPPSPKEARQAQRDAIQGLMHAVGQ